MKTNHACSCKVARWCVLPVLGVSFCGGGRGGRGIKKDERGGGGEYEFFSSIL